MSSVSLSPSLSRPRGRGLTRPSSPRQTADLDVLIVDDRPVASRAGWTLLGRERQVRTTATAESSGEAVRVAREQNPHVCAVSATLDDWLSLARRLKQLGQPPRVLIYGGEADARLTGRAIVAEADAVLHHYAAPDDLAEGISRVAAGDKFFPTLLPDGVDRLLDSVDDPDRAIVAMLLERIPPDYIASTLGLSAKSLRSRREAILTRLDATWSSEGSRRRQTARHGQALQADASLALGGRHV
jgi:DNA-binding NarL/FixJ family response regulator